MNEDLILLTIQHKFCIDVGYSTIWRKMPRAASESKYVIEGLTVMAHYPLLKSYTQFMFRPLLPALQNLNENVCFLNIDEDDAHFNGLVGSCDWCSMFNGVLETAKQNIIKDPTITKRIDFEMLKHADTVTDALVFMRTEKLTNERIEEWCETTFGTKTIDLLLFSRIYLKGEMLELRWCPFKRSKEFYYRNWDKRYLEPMERMVREVGKILATHETVTCNNCPKIVNEKWEYSKSNEDSMFQPLLDYMLGEIDTFHSA